MDLPSLASLREKEAVDAAEQFAQEHHVATRTLRKPHGWTPPPTPPEDLPSVE